ncbi:MAG: ATP-binding cassette domain-containing protein [Bacteriovoracaceae bacterium]
MTKTNAIYLKDLQFSYGKNIILSIPELSVPIGESLFLYGPSGSGKSTLLNLLLGVHLPQTGLLEIMGHNLSLLSTSERDHLRGEKMGAIFQSFNLIPFLTVEENILLPLKINARRKVRVKDLKGELELLLEHLKLAPLRKEKAQSLSVGQQQRVAAARSLIGSPEVIIADEPTSALDYDHKEAFIELLMKEKERTGATLVFVSHDQNLKKLFSREIDLTCLNQVIKKHEVWS